MTLRGKTLSIIGLTLLLLIVVLFLITQGIVHSGFKKVENDLTAGIDKIEKADTRQNVQRVTDALRYKIDNLATKAADWAQWDDTYRFVIDRNRAFIQSNLNKDALSALKINMILMLNARQEMVFGIAFDLDKNETVDISQGMRYLIRPGSFLLRHDSAGSVISGIAMLPENPLMIVSRPVIKSDGSGPIRGTFIFAQYLTDSEIQQLATMTHLKINIRRIDSDIIPEDCRQVVQGLSGKDTIAVRAAGEDYIDGYAEIKDLENKNALLLRVDVPRSIHKQGMATLLEIHKRGRVTLLSIIVSIIATGLVLGLAILFILEFSVLSRLGRLTRKTVEIGSSKDFSGRVSIEGKDEIATLGTSINTMLSVLASAHAEIQLKSAEMQLLMNTVPAGLVSLDEQFLINPHFSNAATRILGQDILTGRSFLDVLGLTQELGREADRKKLFDFIDFFRQALLPEHDMAPLNPLEELVYSGNGSPCWLRLRYYLIDRQGKPYHILAVIEDITEEKKLADQVARSQRENMQLKAIAENPDLFREFLVETRHIIETVVREAGKLDTKGNSRPVVNDIFRGVHTIKGVAGSFGLFNLADVASNLEDRLSPLRDSVVISTEAIEETNAELARLSKVFSGIVEDAKRLLGDDIEKESGVFLRIPLEELKRHIFDINNMAIDETLKHAMIDKLKEEIVKRLRTLLVVPAKRGFARAVKIVPGLIQRLGKNAQFNFIGQDTPVDCEVAGELNTPLVHLLRNAFDHGVESSEERAEKGKSEVATVTLSVERKNSHLVISLSDDGRGLDPERLKSVACRKGVITAEESGRLTKEEAYDLIFRPGFSTADTISDVSGRGVGMDAVLTSVKNNLGGDLRIESEINKGTSFIISIPA
jgi:sensor domain CHASE-containing protein/HPt (histidine-containing phosphotransfer) domain-containing protein/HAMP domain-containing protein